MGSSESKMSAPVKPEPAIKNVHFKHLADPRSPSVAIDRTPIQVDNPSTVGALAFTDPRSPSVGINRTPVRAIMRIKVGSLARRLGQLFHSEAEGREPSALRFSDVAQEDDLKGEELAATAPLLTPGSSDALGSLAKHAHLLSTPVQRPPVESLGSVSPFVVLEPPQVEVEVETDVTLEEAEEAKESPLHKRLSMSLITCHDGATSAQILAEVHHGADSSPEPAVEAEPVKDGVEHSYALPSITVKPESQEEPAPTAGLDESPVQTPPTQPEEEEEEAKPTSEDTKDVVEASSPLAEVSSESPSSPPPVAPSPEQPQQQLSTGIRCPTFDSKSPSQVVFKPQWLGKGFGGSGLRARGAQGSKGGSSPLAVRVAVKNATNENKGQTGKLKQKGAQGRSPLQILKETNSPRDQRAQMKLKTSSTPDKQRHGQMDRRVLAVALDKENR